MFEILLKISRYMGIDKAIAYTSGGRIIQGVSGIGTMFFLSTYLTNIEQGFYFTFGSILALQVFFELGLTGIMQQYVAHEVSHLELDENYQYHGEERYCSRLASLVSFCLKWYSALAFIIFLFLIIIGNVYFTRYGDNQSSDVDWRYPWILICIGTAASVFQSPLTAILRGLGFVKDMSKIGFLAQIIHPLFIWIGLVVGLKLYVMGIGYVLSVAIWQIYVFRKRFYKIFVNLVHTNITERVGYFREIFPYQWKIALSWVSGYFIFQFFNPVLFATEGAVVAGQMGMTLQALNAIQSLSFSWINTKIPFFSKLIALNNYTKLDIMFTQTLKQMTSVCSSMLLLFLIFIWFLNHFQLEVNGSILANRFLGYFPTILMCVPVFLQQFTGAWATYLRCHKKEPFLINSIVGGLLCMASTLVFGNLYGLYGITIGYCCIQILLCFWAYKIFIIKKYEWHK